MNKSTAIVVFADLDDTLFQTLRKLPDYQANSTALVAATRNTKGEPHSYSTPAQWQMLKLLLDSGACLIPVTGRNVTAYQRLDFWQSSPPPNAWPHSFARWPFDSWQVLDHGLTLLSANGEPELTWQAQVNQHLAPLQERLQQLGEQLRPQAEALGCRLSLHTNASGQPFMWVIKHPSAAPEPLRQLQQAWHHALADSDDLQVIANSNNLSLLPRHVGKAQAVNYLRQHYFANSLLTVGLGDSISDLPFLQEVDFAITPSKGQLLRALQGIELEQR